MANPKPMTRRDLLHLGAVGGIGVAGGRLLPDPAPDSNDCATPTQTSGPFYPRRKPADGDLDLTVVAGHAERAQGEVVTVGGQVLDGDLRPVAGALVEIWQANTHGRYHHEADPNPAPEDPAFEGFGEVRTDAEGRYRFRTIIPGAYPADEAAGWWRPPHIHIKVAKRGYHELITQMYFHGHALNDVDRVLNGIPEDERGRVVVAFAEGDEPGVKHGTFTIVLQKVA
ncbi:hypothetical protein [Rubrivirga sp. IMCC43871]|uniref:dioxygenase family protein n=1 Tax=Rubrivirga sp. IMCC43871 TaxID=3391575 RepID=UPI00398FAF73